MWKVLVLLVLMMGCAAPRVPAVQKSEQTLASPREVRAVLLAKADGFERMGAHLEASYFLEAVLAQGGDEYTTLPRLIGALVRANRLRAARTYLHRLQQLVPGDRNVEELSLLLARFTPRDLHPAPLEVTP